MRRIVMFNRVSADGYFAAPDGGLDGIVPEPALDAAAAGHLDGTGTILFGRVTYEQFASFWPKAVGDGPTVEAPHGDGGPSAELRAMGVWINAATELVFSTTLREVTWSGSRVLPTIDPAEIAALKRAPGTDIMMFGSGSIVSQLTQHGLIDEYQLVVAPIFLGAGRSLLHDVAARTKLRLADSKAYPNGNVALRYVRGGEHAGAR